MMKTYTIVDDSGLIHTRLRELLSAWREVPLDHAAGNRVDFVWLNTGNDEDKRVFTIAAALKNSFDDGKRVITNKLDMSLTFMRLFPAVAKWALAGESCDFRTFKYSRGVYIVKPAQRGYFSGHGIMMVANRRDFDAAKRALVGVKALVTEYISGLLLPGASALPPTNLGRAPGEYKFHLRMYWLVNQQPYFHKLWEVGKILTAKLPYRDADWANKDIHDSHFSGSLEDLYFPAHFPGDAAQTSRVYEQMVLVTKCLAAIYRPKMRAWPEADNAYEVFGLDFMIRKDYTPVLLELNDKVGFLTNDGTKNEFSAGYIDWVYTTAIAPYFGQS